MSAVKDFENDSCGRSGCTGGNGGAFLLCLVALVIVLALFGNA